MARKKRAVAPATEGRVRTRRVKAASISSGVVVSQGGGTSQQIPIEVIEKMQHEIVVPPLGHRSFEDFAQLLLESTDYATSVYQFATDVAGLGWHLAPVVQDETMDEAEIEEATRFFANPNPIATIADIVKSTMIDYRALGNGWIEILRENNDPNRKPSGLVHAPGLAMRIRANLKGFVMLGHNESLHRFFRAAFSDPDDPSSVDTDGQTLNEMLYFREYHPASPWYGVPRIVPAMKAIKGSGMSSDRNIRYFTNRAFPEYVVTLEGNTDNINDAELEALEDDIKEHFRNLVKGEDYKTFFTSLPVGLSLKLERLAAPFDDTDLRDYRIDNRDEIVRSQGMMPNRIGIIESGNLGGGTGEAQMEIYKNSTIKPPQEMVERAFNAILHTTAPLGFGLKTVKFKFDELDSIDEQREANIAGTISSTGWMTINEGRAYASQFLKTNLEPIEEPWADLPLQLVVPQLAQFFEPIESLQMEPGLTPGISPLGTPEISPQTRAIVHSAVAVDKAYRRFRERSLQPAPAAASNGA